MMTRWIDGISEELEDLLYMAQSRSIDISFLYFFYRL